MNKSLKEKGLDPFVQAYRRSLRIFLNFKIFLEVKQSIIRGGREVGSYLLMWNILWEQVYMMETWKNS